MKPKKYTSIYYLLGWFLLPLGLIAQENTLLEIQSSIGLVNLIPTGEKGMLYPVQPTLLDETIETLNYTGRNIDIGFLGNRSLGKSFSLRSGLQLFDLQSKINYKTEIRFVAPPQEVVEDNSFKITTNLRGYQIPVLFGYSKSFGKWTGFTELGASLSWSPVKIKREIEQTFYYDYGITYADSCGCTFLIDVQKKPVSEQFQYKNDSKQHQFEARGIFGLGVLIPQKEGRSLRVSYRLSGSLQSLSKGTREYGGLYEPYEIYDQKYHHLLHQLEFAWGWPQKKSLNVETKNPDGKTIVSWKGVFAGVGISVLYPMQEGSGWGRNVQLMYLSRWGFGARFEMARLVAPSSYYGITSRFNKAQLLYHLGYGVQFHAGGSWGVGGDGDGTPYNADGVHAGGSILLPLSTFMGIHIQATGHYFFEGYGDRISLESGAGVVYRIWR